MQIGIKASEKGPLTFQNIRQVKAGFVSFKRRASFHNIKQTGNLVMKVKNSKSLSTLALLKSDSVLLVTFFIFNSGTILKRDDCQNLLGKGGEAGTWA
jgi:hypothetical protein